MLNEKEGFPESHAISAGIINHQKRSENHQNKLNTKRCASARKINPRADKKKTPNLSLWTLHENLKYANFLQKNRSLFESENIDRRVAKVNVRMSKYMSTRTPEQCRSHNQKMMKFHSNITGILQYIKTLYESMQRTNRSLIIDAPKRMRNKPSVVQPELPEQPKQEEMIPLTPLTIEKSLWNVLQMEWSQSATNKNR